MSLVKAVSFQIGQSLTASNNFTWHQPSTPDGTVRLGIGNAGATSGDVLIASSTGISTPSLVVSGSTAPTNGMFLPAANTLAWSTNSSERLRLDASGNLGLGVTPNAWRTDVSFKALQMPGGTFAAYVAGGVDPTPNISANAYVDSGGTWRYLNARAASWYIQNGGMHAWYNAVSGTAGNAISFTQAMTLDASGNLLVGTTSFNYAANGVGIRSNAYSYFTATSNASILLNRKGTSGSLVSINYEDSVVGSISTNGTTTAYNTTSDQRLKTNITPAGSAIQSILDFPVDQFDWISSGEHQDFGGVAQKIIPVIPEMVSVPEDPEQMMGVDWSKAVPRLIKAFQELSQELESLKAKVNA